MRIIHLVNHCCLGHGNAHVAVDLACEQAADGDDVLYLSEGGDFEDLLTRSGVRHRFLKQKTRNPLKVLDSLARLVAGIRRHKTDIVHAHMMSGALLGYLASRIGRARLVTTVHNSFDAHSVLMQAGDLIVAVSEAEQRHLRTRRFPARKLVTILNGPLFGARLGQGSDTPSMSLPRPSITTVCGLHPRKGVADLIRSFAEVAASNPAPYLNIVGDGPSRGEFEALAAATGFGARIRFHGNLSNPLALLNATDIFVLASHSDPFPLVNLEARLAGCAMIGTEVGGIPEALEFGNAGLLVPPGDPPSIARAIRRLLDEEGELASFKARSRSGVEKFSVRRMHLDYRQAYEAVLADVRQPARALKQQKSAGQDGGEFAGLELAFQGAQRIATKREPRFSRQSSLGADNNLGGLGLDSLSGKTPLEDEIYYPKVDVM